MPMPDKLKITAYKATGNKKVLSKDPDDTYVALVNPETYTIKHEVKWTEIDPNTGVPQEPKFVNIPQPTYQFDFLFDSTGVIPPPSNLGVFGDIPLVGAVAGLISPAKPYDVMAEIEKFKKVVLDYNGDQHSPRTINLLWGKLVFDGKLSALSFNFKLFQPNGTPIRAVATATFIDSITEQEWLDKYKPNSPDLTHVRQVMEGDTLPLMAYRIYGDASYYLEVARVNNIVNFRNLKVGDRINFPPINNSNKVNG